MKHVGSFGLGEPEGNDRSTWAEWRRAPENQVREFEGGYCVWIVDT